ncbi:MAG TPA: sigma-70 family RNA polymerase sigma factor [Vicinamibacteria bacterium]|nr:sigma-70 family RNA polymerase sigma factor [Vicinamibacteria bacterium]
MDATASYALPLPLLVAARAVEPAVAAERPAASDLELIEGAAGGDTQAFAALYARHSRPVFGVLLRLAGRRALAEDWLQETFVRVWLAASTHDPARGAVRSWIFKIALNVARSELARKRHTAPHLPLDELDLAGNEAPEARLAEDLDGEERARALAEALARLPDFMREVVVLRCSRELSFAQIAEVTGAPEGTLKSRFHRAVAALRSAMLPGRTGR